MSRRRHKDRDDENKPPEATSPSGYHLRTRHPHQRYAPFSTKKRPYSETLYGRISRFGDVAVGRELPYETSFTPTKQLPQPIIQTPDLGNKTPGGGRHHKDTGARFVQLAQIELTNGNGKKQCGGIYQEQNEPPKKRNAKCLFGELETVAEDTQSTPSRPQKRIKTQLTPESLPKRGKRRYSGQQILGSSAQQLSNLSNQEIQHLLAVCNGVEPLLGRDKIEDALFIGSAESNTQRYVLFERLLTEAMRRGMSLEYESSVFVTTDSNGNPTHVAQQGLPHTTHIRHESGRSLCITLDPLSAVHPSLHTLKAASMLFKSVFPQLPDPRTPLGPGLRQ